MDMCPDTGYPLFSFYFMCSTPIYKIFPGIRCYGHAGTGIKDTTELKQLVFRKIHILPPHHFHFSQLAVPS